MPTTMKDLGIDKLDRAEQLALAEEILDSLAAAPLTDAQRAELDRRLADHRANPEDVIPWEEIEAEDRARYGS
jgi:putative addiction module component (TIGR02574 family)